jgi:hypothetical protein
MAEPSASELSPGGHLLVSVIGGIVGGIKELEKEFPVGTEVTFVGPQGPFGSGTIYKWDYQNWKCILSSGRFARYNSLLYNVKIVHGTLPEVTHG